MGCFSALGAWELPEGSGSRELPGVLTRARARVELTSPVLFHRKIRCDRKTPCEACCRRGEEKTCHWETPRIDAAPFVPLLPSLPGAPAHPPPADNLLRSLRSTNCSRLASRLSKLSSAADRNRTSRIRLAHRRTRTRPRSCQQACRTRITSSTTRVHKSRRTIPRTATRRMLRLCWRNLVRASTRSFATLAHPTLPSFGPQARSGRFSSAQSLSRASSSSSRHAS